MALIAAAAAGGFLASKITSSMNKQSASAGVPAVAPSVTTVDPKRAAAENAGRAALIQTSPQGVLGTDPTGRRRLLS